MGMNLSSLFAVSCMELPPFLYVTKRIVAHDMWPFMKTNTNCPSVSLRI